MDSDAPSLRQPVEAVSADELARLVRKAGRGPLTTLTPDDVFDLIAERDAASKMFPQEWRAANQITDGPRRRARLKALRERAVRVARAAIANAEGQ